MEFDPPLAVVDTSRLTAEGDALGFHYRDRLGRKQRGLLVRWQGKLYAYHNRCPHWSTPLDEDGPELFDHGSGTLICQTHGARFEPETGECIEGPCLGDRLTPLAIEEIDETRVEIRRGGLDLNVP